MARYCFQKHPHWPPLALMPYSCMAIWQHYKCNNLVRELCQLDLPSRNESKNGLVAYFLGISSVNIKQMVATPQKCHKFGGSGAIETVTYTIIVSNKHFGEFWDTLDFGFESKKVLIWVSLCQA
jgi:hypothetical protein